MFEINEGDLPFVRTRQALLILDLQNDFVSTGCLLPVEKPPEFVEKIIDLVPLFRMTGNVFWIRSQFEVSRPINDRSPDAERVITDNEVPDDTLDTGASSIHRARQMAKKKFELYGTIMAEGGLDDHESDLNDPNEDKEDEKPYNNETFLTSQNGESPRIALPMTLGANFTQAVAQAVDATKDIVFAKSHYSAFKSGKLLQTLRGQFVTELFVCGALSNISIFATVLEAAQYGFQITLVDDCIGYRSQVRHDEARRQMIEATGCDTMESLEVKNMINRKILAPSNRPTDRRRAPGTQDRRNLHDMMTELKLKNETDSSRSNGTTSSHSMKLPVQTTNGVSKVARDSPDTILSTSDEAVQLLQLSKKPENEERKRVPNKIKTRRRRSDSATVDPEKNGILKNGESRHAKKTTSTTYLTISGAADALNRIAPKDPDAGIVAASSTNKQPELEILLEVDGPRNMSNVGELASMRQKAKSPLPRAVKVIPVHATESSLSMADSYASATEANTTASRSIQIDNAVSPLYTSLPSSGCGIFDPSSSQDTYQICEGDTMIIHNLLPKQESENIFERVRDEIRWQKMSHQGGEVPRLVAVQGEIDEDGSIPIYRHPADESPPLLGFSPTVSIIKTHVEKILGHTVNHCLIQFYRSGSDYISEHSDKTLDIAPNTFIANVSLGAMRAMTFRTKKPLKNYDIPISDETVPRMSCRAPLPHNSMCKMSLRTNEKWLHSIRQDKRLSREKSDAELAYGGCRISLTFRLIHTFLDKGQVKIWGKGAVAKEKAMARHVINGETAEAEKMLQAFGRENHSSAFDWQGTYGAGFDVLHISNRKKLFLSGDSIMDLRVRLALTACGIEYIEGKLSPPFNWKDGMSHIEDVPEVPETHPVRFVDNDAAKSEVEGDTAILLYLDAMAMPTSASSASNPSSTHLLAARKFTRLHQVSQILQKWRATPLDVKSFRRALAVWEGYAKEEKFIAGPEAGVVDWAFWPVLREIVREWGDGVESVALSAYLDRVAGMEAVKGLLGGEAGRRNDVKEQVQGRSDGEAAVDGTGLP